MSEETEINVTPEEIQALKEKAQKAEEYEAKLKELENDPQERNWRKIRAANEALKKHLEASGKKVDEDGNVVEENKFSADEIAKIADERAEKKFIERSVAQAISGLNEEDKKVFNRYFEKATYGETVNSDNVDQFINEAMRMAGGSAGRSFETRSAAARGGAPVINQGDRVEYHGSVAGMAAIAQGTLRQEYGIKRRLDEVTQAEIDAEFNRNNF